MINEKRIAALSHAMMALIEVAGANENTKLYPNVEVINASPADLPAGYIIVEDESGHYIPAVLVAGLSVSNGDKINLLYVKGTEPIAFQQGSEGTAPTDGWPFTNLKTVSSTDEDADYADLETAIADAGNFDVFLLDNETYVISDTLVVPQYCGIIGENRYRTIIQLASTATGDAVIEFSEGGPSFLKEVTIDSVKTSGSVDLIYIDSTVSARILDCYLKGDAYTLSALHVNADSGPATALLRDCYFAGSVGTAVEVETGGAAVGADIINCLIVSFPTVFDAVSASHITSNDTIVRGYTTLGTHQGTVIDDDEDEYLISGIALKVGSGASVNEIATTVGDPGDDTTLVTEQGIREALDLVGGGGAWPDDQKAMIGTTEYATITLADAAAGAGDVIKVGGGVFAEQVTLDGTTYLIGTGQGTIIDTSTSPAVTNGIANAVHQNYSADCDAGTEAIAFNISNSAFIATLRNLRLYAHGTGSNKALSVGSSEAEVYSCILIADTGTSNYALYKNGTVSGSTKLVGCHLTGDVFSSAGTIYLIDCFIDGDVETDTTGTIIIIGGYVTGDITETAGTIVLHGLPKVDGTVGTGVAGAYDLATTVGDPGVDTKVVSEQGIREALDALSVGQSYVDRGDPSAVDWDTEDLTLDGAYHDLDLSSIVTDSAATLVHLSVRFNHNTASSQFVIRENGNSNAVNGMKARIQVSGIPRLFSDFVSMDASRVVEYTFPTSTTEAQITVRGWFV